MKTQSLLFILLSASIAYSQNSIILQPDAAAGKDASIFNRDALANYGNDVDLIATQWDFSGEPGTVRSLLQFDLSSIPKGAEVTDARLSLYYNDQSATHGQAGNNAAYLRRLIQPWEENTVAWNMQPWYTTDNEVLLPASTTPDQDYENIDVTQLVRDMLMYPNTSFGFMLMLQMEEGMNSIKFYSSDGPSAFERPKLQVTWGTVGSDDVQYKELAARPNPFDDSIILENLTGDVLVIISDVNGKPVYEQNKSGGTEIRIDELHSLPGGIYFITAKGESGTYFNKIVKN